MSFTQTLTTARTMARGLTAFTDYLAITYTPAGAHARRLQAQADRYRQALAV